MFLKELILFCSLMVNLMHRLQDRLYHASKNTRENYFTDIAVFFREAITEFYNFPLRLNPMGRK